MKLHTSLTFWSATFFSTLGLTPMVACGGATTDGSGDQNQSGNDAGSGGDGSGGSGTGGAATGGVTGDGGAGGIVGTGGAGAGGAGGITGDGGAGGISTGGWGGAGGIVTGGIVTGGVMTGGIVTGGIATGGWGGAGGIIGTGGSGGTTGGFLSCRNPSSIIGPDGQPTGYVACEGGSRHRAEKRECGSSLPRATSCPYPADAGFADTCYTDSDCTALPNGHCESGPPAPACWCTYGCTKDADCAAGQICDCGDPVGRCVPTDDCTSDADCQDGALCLSYDSMPGCGGTTYRCQTPLDTCVSTADCGASEMCGLSGTAHACAPISCAIGRPFLVGGEARLAGVEARMDWASDVAPRVDGLSTAARAALAARWTEIGLMEHASIAAFARFALEILSLGAPPSLVVQTHSAMADETVHARDAFALASAYAGRPVGPGPLDVASALAARTPLEIVRTTILEGCIGETIAAVEASEALAHATDGAVRAALGRVVQDETRHAELAWRFVQWVLEHGPGELREAAARELAELVDAELASARAATVELASVDEGAERAHGVVPAATRLEIRRRVLAEVVGPCARALARSAAGGRSVATAQPIALA